MSEMGRIMPLQANGRTLRVPRGHLMNAPVTIRSAPWNKGKLGPAQAPRHLGNLRSPPARQEDPRPGALQSGHRFEAEGMRPRQSSDRRRCLWRGHQLSSDCAPAEDRAPGPVRDHQANPGISGSVDRCCWPSYRRLSFPDEVASLPASVHATVRPNSPCAGRCYRARGRVVWDAHHAPNEGLPYLQADSQPSRSATPSGTH